MRIPIEQQIIGVVFSAVLLMITVQLVRKHRLREQHALVWLGASFTIFLLAVFDPLVGALARAFDVTYAPTLILVFGLLFSLVVLLSQSVTISTQADRIRDLAQSYSLLEWRLHQLEETTVKPASEDGHPPVGPDDLRQQNSDRSTRAVIRHIEELDNDGAVRDSA